MLQLELFFLGVVAGSLGCLLLGHIRRRASTSSKTPPKQVSRSAPADAPLDVNACQHLAAEHQQAETDLQPDQVLRASEERFRWLIQNVDVGILLAGINAEILTCNQVAQELLGLSEAELLSRTALDSVWNAIHEDGSAFEPPTFPIPQAIATQHAVRNVVMGVLYQQVQRLNQELEQRVQERTTELEKSRDLFEAVFQESADAIFLVDPDSLLILDCNQRAVELFEAADKTQLIGLRGHTLHTTPFSDAELARMRQVFRLQGIWSQEIEYHTFQGHDFWGNLASKRIQVA